jgi:penicillin amidase
MEDMMDLQTDYLSIPARILVPLLENITFHDSLTNAARNRLMEWSYVLDGASVAAGIYVAWERELHRRLFDFMPDPAAEEIFAGVQMATLMGWILNPETRFAGDPVSNRDNYLKGSFISAVEGLKKRFGTSTDNWRYGQENYKHVWIRHPLGEVVNLELQEKLNTGPLPRGGNQYTPGATSGTNNQSSGASFRMIVDVNDWDSSVCTNVPGQSGDPASPFYDNLFEPWATDEFFPIYFTRQKIESSAIEKTKLLPLNGNQQDF